jgi:hypothetical protein
MVLCTTSVGGIKIEATFSGLHGIVFQKIQLLMHLLNWHGMTIKM